MNPTVIIMCVYSLTHPPVLEIFKETILVCNCTSQEKNEAVKEPSALSQKPQFFKVFEVTGTGGSLILE
jgi:hypothetical protein